MLKRKVKEILDNIETYYNFEKLKEEDIFLYKSTISLAGFSKEERKSILFKIYFNFQALFFKWYFRKKKDRFLIDRIAHDYKLQKECVIDIGIKLEYIRKLTKEVNNA